MADEEHQEGTSSFHRSELGQSTVAAPAAGVHERSCLVPRFYIRAGSDRFSRGLTEVDISQTPTHARLEDLTPGAPALGVLPDRAVTVVQVEWHGTQALTLTYRDDAGKVDHELLYRANEARM